MKIKQKYIDIKKQNIKDYFDEKAIYALIKRVAGKKYCDKIILEHTDSDGFDFYEVFDKGDKVCIRANTGVSFAKGFNSYLKEICHYSVGILSTSGTLPENPPSVGKTIKEKSAFLYRYFYNYCTFSYTYAFDTWKDWEKTLDYLLLSGYNLILNPIGIESVWKKVLEKIGYSKKDITEFICGPAFYAWQWMMNMTGWAGGAPDWWYDFREELSGKFNQRLQSFGVAVVNAGYVGLVPDDFSKYYPDSNIKEQGEWVSEYMSPSLITPQDPNYNRLADIYYSEMRKIKGGDKVKYYSVDPFHEGGDCSKIDLKAFVLGNFNKMREHCPEAVWVLQEWGEPKSYLAEAMPDGGMVMVSLSADNKDPNAVDTTGAPWCYCAVNSFGGQYYLEGNAEKSLLNPFKHLENETSNILGIGYMPEAVNCCELLYSVYAENTYRAKAMEPADFIRKYMLESYGSENEDIYKALKNVFYNIYDKQKNPSTGESGLCARPALDVVHTSMWSNSANPYNKQEDLISYIKTMLGCYDEMHTFAGYRLDLLEAARQSISQISWYFIEKIKDSYKGKDVSALSYWGNELLGLFDLQTALLKTDKSHLLGTWLEKAKNLGRTPAEKTYFEWNARTLITLWGNQKGARDLHDYSAREWQGLLEDFYKPRWERFISRLEISLLTGKKYLPADDYNEEVAFTYEKKKYPNKPSGDLKKAVENILKKVTSVEIEDGIVIKDTSSFEEKVMADINKKKK